MSAWLVLSLGGCSVYLSFLGTTLHYDPVIYLVLKILQASSNRADLPIELLQTIYSFSTFHSFEVLCQHLPGNLLTFCECCGSLSQIFSVVWTVSIMSGSLVNTRSGVFSPLVVVISIHAVYIHCPTPSSSAFAHLHQLLDFFCWFHDNWSHKG